MEPKRLFRSKSNQVIAGVCGGLGEYFNTDPILFRLLFVVAFIFCGSGLLVYIILWIAVPENPAGFNSASNLNHDTMNENTSNYQTDPNAKPTDKKQERGDGNLWGGVILIALGAIFLIDRFVPRIDFGDLWPVILIAVGAILITKAYQKPVK